MSLEARGRLVLATAGVFVVLCVALGYRAHNHRWPLQKAQRHLVAPDLAVVRLPADTTVAYQRIYCPVDPTECERQAVLLGPPGASERDFLRRMIREVRTSGWGAPQRGMTKADTVFYRDHDSLFLALTAASDYPRSDLCARDCTTYDRALDDHVRKARAGGRPVITAILECHTKNCG